MTQRDERSIGAEHQPVTPAGSGPVLDSALFRQAFEELSPAVFRYAAARVGPDAAEEILAETFTTAWRNREKFVDPSDNGLEAWLIGVATHVVARHRRAEGRWLQSCADTSRLLQETFEGDDEMARADSRIDSNSRARRLGAALQRVPRRDRDPFLLHVLEDLSYEEIARILDIPIGTVRSRISRGRERLARRMGKGGES